MHSPVAIIFIHTGDSDYLQHSLRQATSSNPKSPVYLIGDETTAGKYGFVEHVPYAPYVTAARRFASMYRHLNTNAHPFELFCIMRWFILRDFMAARNVDAAVYLDSDIMLYEEMHYEHFRYYDYDLAVTGVAPPVLINSVPALDAFCTLVESCYTDPARLSHLEHRFQRMQAEGRPGGICDMTFWEMFKDSSPVRIFDFSPQCDGAIYDRNIFLADGFETENRMKKVVWREGKPFGIRSDDGRAIRFKALHFHGPAKEVMGNYVSC